MTNTDNEAMWIDRTGWTWIPMRGADRVDLLNRLSTNDLTQLQAGKGLQTVLTTDKARIIDVLMVLNDADRSMMLASPGMGPKILQWLRTYTITDDVRLVDATSLVEMIEVTGARAADVVKSVTGINVALFTIGEWIATSIGEQDLYVFRMPPTLELSYWLVGNPDVIRAIKSALAEVPGLEEPLTDAEIEYLRVMRGIGASAHEWTDAYNPLEAGLLHLTSFTKGCYIGQEIIARLDSYNKVKQRILGFVSDTELHVGDVIAPINDDASASNTAIGALTTVTRGRNSKSWYALGYIRGEHAHPGTSVEIRTANETGRAVVQLLPMVDA